MRGWYRDSARHSLAARGIRIPKKSYIGPEERRYRQLEEGRDTRPLEPSIEELQGDDAWWEDHIEDTAKRLRKENPNLEYEESLDRAAEIVERIVVLKKEIEGKQDEFGYIHDVILEISDTDDKLEMQRKLYDVGKEIDVMFDELSKLGGSIDLE